MDGLMDSLASWTKFMRQTFAHVECLFIFDLYGGGPKSGGGELISAKRLDITFSPDYALSKRRQGAGGPARAGEWAVSGGGINRVRKPNQREIYIIPSPGGAQLAQKRDQGVGSLGWHF